MQNEIKALLLGLLSIRWQLALVSCVREGIEESVEHTADVVDIEQCCIRMYVLGCIIGRRNDETRTIPFGKTKR